MNSDGGIFRTLVVLPIAVLALVVGRAGLVILVFAFVVPAYQVAGTALALIMMAPVLFSLCRTRDLALAVSNGVVEVPEAGRLQAFQNACRQQGLRPPTLLESARTPHRPVTLRGWRRTYLLVDRSGQVDPSTAVNTARTDLRSGSAVLLPVASAVALAQADWWETFLFTTQSVRAGAVRRKSDRLLLLPLLLFAPIPFAGWLLSVPGAAAVTALLPRAPLDGLLQASPAGSAVPVLDRLDNRSWLDLSERLAGSRIVQGATTTATSRWRQFASTVSGRSPKFGVYRTIVACLLLWPTASVGLGAALSERVVWPWEQAPATVVAQTVLVDAGNEDSVLARMGLNITTSYTVQAELPDGSRHSFHPVSASPVGTEPVAEGATFQVVGWGDGQWRRLPASTIGAIVVMGLVMFLFTFAVLRPWTTSPWPSTKQLEAAVREQRPAAGLLKKQ